MSKELKDRIVPLDRVYALECDNYLYVDSKTFGTNVVYILLQEPMYEHVGTDWLPSREKAIILTGEHAGESVRDKLDIDDDIVFMRVDLVNKSRIAYRHTWTLAESNRLRNRETRYKNRTVTFGSAMDDRAFNGAKFAKVGDISALADEYNRVYEENAIKASIENSYAKQSEQDMEELFGKGE